jgi:hypothetical protein
MGAGAVFAPPRRGRGNRTSARGTAKTSGMAGGSGRRGERFDVLCHEGALRIELSKKITNGLVFQF